MVDPEHTQLQHERALFESLYRLSLREARERLLAAFERAYLERLLERANGNVAAAARLADVDRGTLFRMLKRLGLRVERRGHTSDARSSHER